METTVLKVAGMSCGGCVKSVTNVLTALPGVGKAEVTLQPGEAKVEFDPAQVNARGDGPGHRRRRFRGQLKVDCCTAAILAIIAAFPAQGADRGPRSRSLRH